MNVDEAPAFNEAAPIARSIVEETGARLVGLPVVATDPDGTSVTYEFEGDVNKADEAFFEIDSATGQLMTKVAGLDHEAKESRMVTVVAAGSAKKADSEDSEESKVKAIVSITVIDKQEPPMFDDEGPATIISVQETDTGTLSPLVSATDPDEDGSVTYFLRNPGTMPFSIARATGELSIVGKLDYETLSSYALMVIAVDQGGRTAERQVTINVSNVPEPPMFPVNSAELFVYEGRVGQKVLDPTGALIATDGDKQPLTFTLSGGPETSFNINRASFDRNTGVSQAQLTTKVPLDHATPPISPLRERSPPPMAREKLTSLSPSLCGTSPKRATPHPSSLSARLTTPPYSGKPLQWRRMPSLNTLAPCMQWMPTPMTRSPTR